MGLVCWALVRRAVGRFTAGLSDPMGDENSIDQMEKIKND